MTKATQNQNSYEFFSNIFSSITNFIFNTIEAIVIALALSIVLYLFIATPHEVVGRSMDPSFKNGEYLIGNKITYRFYEPKRGDVVIYEFDKNVDYIKRIIALPNEEVALKEGYIYINGEKLDESKYLQSFGETSGGDFLYEGASVTIPEEHYLTLGDNRSGSYDSRSFGTIERSKIKGKAALVYFPFGSFRIIEHKEASFIE